MKSSEYFYDEIIYNEEMTKRLRMFKVINSLKYMYLEIVIFVLNFLTNIYFLFFWEEFEEKRSIHSIFYVELLLTFFNGGIIICWFSTK